MRDVKEVESMSFGLEVSLVEAMYANIFVKSSLNLAIISIKMLHRYRFAP